MVLEKMIDELYELSKKAIASGIHVSFEIGLAGYPCRVWVEEPPENKMTTYESWELIRIRCPMDKNSLSPSYCRGEREKNQ